MICFFLSCEDIKLLWYCFLIWFHSMSWHNSIKSFCDVSFVLLLKKLGWFEAFRFLTFLPKHFYTSSFKLDYLLLLKFTFFTSVISLRNPFWKVKKAVSFHHHLTKTANDINKVLKIFNVFLLMHALFHLMMEIIGGRNVWP